MKKILFLASLLFVAVLAFEIEISAKNYEFVELKSNNEGVRNDIPSEKDLSKDRVGPMLKGFQLGMSIDEALSNGDSLGLQLKMQSRTGRVADYVFERSNIMLVFLNVDEKQRLKSIAFSRDAVKELFEYHSDFQGFVVALEKKFNIAFVKGVGINQYSYDQDPSYRIITDYGMILLEKRDRVSF